MGHSELFQRDFDAADEVEHSVQAAQERAKAGQATADDWMLINWFNGPDDTENATTNTF